MVAEALRAVTEKGLCKQSRELASAALMALSDTELQLITSGQLHVMLSCEFAKPSTSTLDFTPSEDRPCFQINGTTSRRSSE